MYNSLIAYLCIIFIIQSNSVLGSASGIQEIVDIEKLEIITSIAVQTGSFVGRYFLSDVPFGWLNAKTFCENKGMKLLSIETPEENSNILDLLDNSGVQRSWTSGIDLEVDGQYVWSSTGEQFSFANWITNSAPQSPSNNCVFTGTFAYWTQSGLNRSGWYVDNCNSALLFICE